MKKLSFLMIALLAAVVGCNKEPQAEVQGGEAENGQVYMSFRITTPATKSSTDDDGSSNSNPEVEVGKDYENTISSVDIFLRKDGEDAVSVFADNVTAIIGAGTVYSAQFPLDAFTAGDYYVYVICNDNGYTASDLHQVYTAGNEDLTQNIAKQNNFLMTNAKLSDKITIDTEAMKAHTVATNPFDLGTVEVERAAARFDYKAYKTDNKYNLGTEAKAAVQLTDVALINASKSFYYFRRVSADGTNTDWTVSGAETSINYVVDTDYSLKNTAKDDSDVAKANFFDYMDTPADWNYTALTAIAENDNIAGDITTGDVNHGDGYNIWRYAVENTIPGTDNQVHGVTTGVVFKGRLTDGSGNALVGSDPVFVHNNVYYGTWTEVTAFAADADAPTTLVSAVAYVNSLAEGDAKYATRYTDAGFTVYNPTLADGATEGNYELLYYYWNRHNDNGDPNVKGPMEFAVVRNNVYKLGVTNIAKFGYPVSGESPEEPEPDDPDEEINYYFTVSVKVLPWVVRVNDIEF